jgi:hypothetical protein
VVALYKLGVTKHVEKFVQVMEREAAAAMTGEYKEDGYVRIFCVALVQSRTGQRETAEKTYVRLVLLIEQHAKQAESDTYYSSLYNLACLQAQRGDKKSSVESLRKAVVAGYRDRSWIKKDRDLDPIRDEPDFKKLIADEDLFKEKKE